MNKFTHLSRFVQYLFDEKDTVGKGKTIIEGLLKARSPRLSDIAREMPGKEEANYKSIQRFLARTSPKQALLRLFQENASFVSCNTIMAERSFFDVVFSNYILLKIFPFFKTHILWDSVFASIV